MVNVLNWSVSECNLITHLLPQQVEECVWEHTPHIQHGRVDPERYFGTLDKFLKKNSIIQ